METRNRAAGEKAIAKALNRFWCGGMKIPGGGGIGSLQIRTSWTGSYEMIVRVCDQDNDTFLLVAGKIPCFTLCGWSRGDDAKPTFAKQDPTAREPCAICGCSVPGIGREQFRGKRPAVHLLAVWA